MPKQATGMPRPGRPPVTEAIKKLRGTTDHEPGERRVNVPQPPTRLPPPPAILEGEAAEEYARVGAVLTEIGLMSDLDQHLLTRYAHAWAIWLDAIRRVKATSPVIQSNGRLVKNPYLNVARDAAVEMNWCSMQLGLSPISRMRMGQKAGAGDETDPWAAFEPLRVIGGTAA